MSKVVLENIFEFVEERKTAEAIAPKNTVKRKPNDIQRGCDYCPLNKTKANKVINVDRVIGRKAMIIGLTPGEEDDKQRLELVGPPGKFLWAELARVGLKRSDFDVQNIVRCRPTEIRESKWGGKYLVNRNPTKQEIHCCSVFTEQALDANKQQAKVYFILGDLAAKAFLGREYRKGRFVFWSQRLNAKIIRVTHPSYFTKPDFVKSKLRNFRDSIVALREAILGNRDEFSYIKQRNVKEIKDPRRLRIFFKKARLSGERVAVDIESGWVRDEEVLLQIGFCYKENYVRTVFIDHPETPHPKEIRDELFKLIVKFLENPSIEKIFQHGSFDVIFLKEKFGITVRGYTYDTQYAEYLAWSNRRSYSLESIAETRFPQYAGYKNIIQPYLDKAKINFANIPKDILIPYNGADCEITKLIELSTKDRINPALLKVYIYCSFIIDRMEKKEGFTLDMEYYPEVEASLPTRVELLEKRLKVIAGDMKFNPNSHEQVKHVLYQRLKLPIVYEVDKKGVQKPTSNKAALEQLGQHFEFPRLLNLFRTQSKANGYLKSYYKSAELNNGKLKTKWWLTGAVTGRLRSGDASDEGILNFQNFHGSIFLKNLLISDARWRKILLSPPREVSDIMVFLAWDYSQAELRMLAEMSGDPELTKVFLSGEDLHCKVGFDLMGWSKELCDGKPDHGPESEHNRKMIKNCQFGMCYGLARGDGFVNYVKMKMGKSGKKIKKKAILDFYDAYFLKYKMVRVFIDKRREAADKTGFAESLFGFKREIDKQDERGTFWGNQAVNTPIQSSAHQLELIAMAVLYARRSKYKQIRRLLAEIHDALVFLVKTQDLPDAYRLGKELLEQEVPKYVKQWFGIDLKIPIVAEAKAGYRFGTLCEYVGEPVEEFLTKWKAHNEKTEKKVKTLDDEIEKSLSDLI